MPSLLYQSNSIPTGEDVNRVERANNQLNYMSAQAQAVAQGTAAGQAKAPSLLSSTDKAQLAVGGTQSIISPQNYLQAASTANKSLDAAQKLANKSFSNASTALINGTNKGISSLTAGRTSALSSIDQGVTSAIGELSPQSQANRDALSQISELLGLNGGDNTSILQKLESTPGYQFRYQQGIDAVNRQLAARGQFDGRNKMEELVTFGQGIASQELSDQTNRLMNLVGLTTPAVQMASQIYSNAATQKADIYTNTATQTASLQQNLGGSLADIGVQKAGSILQTGTQKANNKKEAIQGAGKKLITPTITKTGSVLYPQ